MTRYFMPIILIGIAIIVFFMETNPLYNDISTLKAQVASYDEALDTSKTLASVRDQLTAKYNNINPNDLTKLETLLPDNINSIRLIMEIEQIASPYGLVLADVRYNTNTATATTATTNAQSGNTSQTSSKDYGVFDLEFSTTGTYDNFISFTKDLEKNLRIVDISSVSFTTSANTKTNTPNTYDYSFKINTYWLKN